MSQTTSHHFSQFRFGEAGSTWLCRILLLTLQSRNVQQVEMLGRMISYIQNNQDIFPDILGLAYYYEENEVHIFV